MNARAWISGLLTVTTIMSGLVAGYAIVFRPGTTLSDPAIDESSARALTPTATAPIPEANDLERVRADIEADGAAAASAVRAIEGNDVAALMAILASERIECAPAGSRGGARPSCEALGIPDGTQVLGFPVDIGGQVVLGSEEGVRAQLQGWLRRAPSLSVVARAPSGALFLGFAVEPSETGANWMSVQTSAEGDKVASVRFGVDTYTAFELFRDSERGGGGSFTVLAASPAELERERVRHQWFEAQP